MNVLWHFLFISVVFTSNTVTAKMSGSNVPPAPFLDLIRLRPFEPVAGSQPIQPNEGWYESTGKPFKMGNTLPIAFGGCTIGIAAAAAHQHLEAQSEHAGTTDFVIISLVGYFLRPAYIDRNYKIRVVPLRSTRTFETKEVRVYQTNTKDQSGATLDLCLTVTCDFMRRSLQGKDNSILRYSKQPRLSPQNGSLSHHSALLPAAQALETKLKEGKISKAIFDAYTTFFGGQQKYNQGKSCPEGIWDQTLWGALKKATTTQDDLPMPDKTGYDWVKVRGRLTETEEEREALGTLPISRAAASASYISWHMDAAISFAPLSFSHRFLDDAAACATLDFALRFHQEDTIIDSGIVDGQDHEQKGWLLREIRSEQSGWERSYSKGTLWREQDAKSELTAVATMTQTSILKNPRPLKGARL